MSGIEGLVNGIIANQQYKKYAALLEKQKQQGLDPAYGQAEGILKSQANTGLPNYEQQKENIDQMTPTTLGAVRDSIDSNKIYSLISNLGVQQQQRQQSLDTNQAGALQGNMNQLAQYLYGVKAPAQGALRDYNTNLTLGAAQAKMEGKQQLAEGAGNMGITGVVSGLLGGGGSTASALASMFKSTTQQTSSPAGAYKQGSIPNGASSLGGGEEIQNSDGATASNGALGKILSILSMV